LGASESGDCSDYYVVDEEFQDAKKRGNHERSIYRRASDGRWVAAISVEDALNGESLRKTKIARSREHARLLLRELQAKYGTHAAVPRKSSLQRIVDSWPASPAVKNLAEATQASYQDTMTRHVLPYLGMREVSEISALSIREWHQRMNLAGVGLRSMENAHAVLSSCLSDAMRRGMVTGNPAGRCPGPSPRPRRSGRSPWSSRPRSSMPQRGIGSTRRSCSG
jgi:integrase